MAAIDPAAPDDYLERDTNVPTADELHSFVWRNAPYIPTVGEWGMILLTFMLGGFYMHFTMRKSRIKVRS